MTKYLVVGLVIVVFAAVLVGRLIYAPQIREAYRRLSQLESELVTTAYGEVEYALREGEHPVMLIHGAGGGFDQGLDLANQNVAEDFAVIAPSRFGYLGSEMPEDATVSQQADALIALLDSLGVEKVAVMAYSAGGPAAVQLGLRNPERVSALILVSTALSDDLIGLPPKGVLKTIMGSDFLFWLLTNPLRSITQRMFIPASLKLSPEEDAEVAATIKGILPVKPRTNGLLFDMFTTNTDVHYAKEQYRLEELTVPTLLINAKDDPAANYEAAEVMHQRIPGSKLVTIEKGGHLMLGNGDTVQAQIDRFLREHIGKGIENGQAEAGKRD